MLNVLLYGITHERKRSDVHDGIKAVVWMYYDNFTDADELEHSFVGLLRKLGDYLETSFDADDIDAAIREAEEDLRSEGRKVRTAVCAAQDENE